MKDTEQTSIDLTDFSDDLHTDSKLPTDPTSFDPSSPHSLSLHSDDEQHEDGSHTLNELTQVSLYPCAAITYIEAVESGQAVEQQWGGVDVLVTLILWVCVTFGGGITIENGTRSSGLDEK